MQDPSAAPNVVGITWDKVRFVGQEAVVLLAAAKTSQGVHTQLMDTPILPLYEWIFTLDEYLGSCWAQVNRCIQHIKAVRRQADLQAPQAGDALVVLAAARLGTTRLIDNMLVTVGQENGSPVT